MDRYQIVEKAGQFNHAGSKATADVAAVAETLGFCPTVVHMNTLKDTKPAKAIRQVGYFTDWIGVTRKIPTGAVVLMQHPFHHVQLTREKNLRKLKEEKRVKFISFVHDVEKLRAFRYNDYYCQEFNTMMELADVLIVHNEVMKEYIKKISVLVLLVVMVSATAAAVVFPIFKFYPIWVTLFAYEIKNILKTKKIPF